MISSFSVHNFRCFSELTISPLEHINLIVGKNNVGKTALLEALWLYYGYYNPNVALSIEGFRGMDKVSSSELLWNLFHDFDPLQQIKLVGKDENGRPRTLRIDLKQLRTSSQDLDTKSARTYSAAAKRTSQGIISTGNSELMFHYTEGSKNFRSRAYIDGNRIKVEQPTGMERIESIFTPSSRREPPEEKSERLSKIMRSRRAKKVIETLQILESRLTNLDILYLSGMPVFHAEIEGEKQLMPLPVMGDGINHLLNITISILSSTEDKGAVFIDEIENGLHFSAMEKIGKAIAELSDSCGVQVFATSHSEECIKAMRRGVVSASVSGRLFRLERQDGEIVSVSYSLDQLAIADEQNIEVR